MFQTGPILFLQSLASGPLTALMILVSGMGTEPFLLVVLAVFMFGVSFRQGFLLLQWMLWSVVVNGALKDAFALPRPWQVDSDVLNEGLRTGVPFRSMGASSFFGLPPRQVIEHVRGVIAAGTDDFGFPSGHVQSATVLWGVLCRCVDVPMLRGLVPAIVVLMAVSRMYLGKHFLADVVAGAALGLLLVAAHSFARRAGWDRRLFESSGGVRMAGLPGAFGILFLAAAPLLLVPLYPGRAGHILGSGVGLLAVMVRGLPSDRGSLVQRAGRVGLAILLFGASSGLLRVGTGIAALDSRMVPVALFTHAVPAFLMIWGTIAIGRRSGLYEIE